MNASPKPPTSGGESTRVSGGESTRESSREDSRQSARENRRGDARESTRESTALPVADARQVRAYARRTLREFRPRFLRAVLLHAAAALAALGTPILLGRMVDALTGPDSSGLTHRLDLMAAAIAALLLLQTALTWQAAVTTYTLGESVLARLRHDFLHDVLRLPLSTIERAGTGDLLARTTRDTEEVNSAIRWNVPQFCTSLVTTAVVLAGSLAVSPLLTASVLVLLPVLYPVVRWYLRRAPAAFAAVQARFSELSATVSESADGARTVEALRWSGRRTQQAERDISATWQAQRRTLSLRSVFFPALDFSVLLPTLVTLLLGTWLAHRGQATAGEVTAVVLLMQMLMSPVIELVRSLEELEAGSASLARLVGVGTVPADRRATGRTPREDATEDVRLSAVRFGYAADREVLRGVDLTLRRGERLAVVGPTGAGKSTLARLITGIHGPDSGTASVGGVPLTELPLEQLRARVALLTQEHHVFTGTLADNLRLAAPDADDQQLRQALAAVGAADWASGLPQGLGTLVGDRHEVVTPARAQQLAMARLLVSAPATLVLDEATSMLPPHAARDVEQTMARLLQGRTVVAIAHRLHTADDADRIAVVEDGVLTELGSHAELLARGDAYARLWKAWHTS